MGSEIRVLAPSGVLAEAVQLVEGLVARWEAALSRFRPDSELSQLNASAGRDHPAGPILLDAVAAALAGAEATGGLFDPLLGLTLVRLGYDRSFEALGDAPAMPPSLVREGWRRVRVDRARGTVRLPAHTALDLGGIGKGLVVDEALAQLERRGWTPALVSAGGDLGVRGVPEGGSWPLSVGSADPPPVVWLERGALATSGSTRRRWTQSGVLRHHLLDPATGEPARSALREITVAATTCAQAEVAATAAFVAGLPAGLRLVERHGLAALALTEHGNHVRAGRWPADPPQAA
jgi:thiamine biosynthesis lipoprotein